MFYVFGNFLLGLTARARTCGRVTSGAVSRPLGQHVPLGAKCTRRARGMTPRVVCSAWVGGTQMARGGTRRGPGSLEYACPSAKKRVFFLAPFSTFSSPFSPIRPHPQEGGAPTTGGGFDARAVYGGPCTAQGNEGRASPRETLAGAARGRGPASHSHRQP
jgi:hypothetical protein